MTDELSQDHWTDEPIDLTSEHWVEALDRAFVMSRILETMSKHPVFLQTPELRKHLEDIQENIDALYQHVGVIAEKIS